MGSLLEDAPVRTATDDYPELVVEWLPTAGPFAADGEWCDITAYVTGGSCTSGRQYELERFQAGSCDLTLTASSRLFDPDYAAGPFAPHLVPMRQLRVSAVWGSVRYPVWRGHISDWGSTTVGADNQFVTQVRASDALALCESMRLPGSWWEVAVTKTRPDYRYKLDEETGTTAYDSGLTATVRIADYVGSPTLGSTQVIPYSGGQRGVTLNGTSQYVELRGDGLDVSANAGASFACWFVADEVPSATAYLLASGGFSLAYIGITTSGYITVSGYGSFTGSTNLCDGSPHYVVVTRTDSVGTTTVYIDGASVGTNTNLPSEGPNKLVGAGSATDGFSNFFTGTISDVCAWDRCLTSTEVTALYAAGASAHSGDDTGAHLARILNYRGWPTTLRNIETGASTIGAYELPATLAEAITRVGDTEAGQTYVDTQGRIAHRNRHNLWLDTRSRTSQATFGDAHSAATLKYVAEGFQLVRDQQRIRNPVSATRSGGVTFTAQDLTLIEEKYGDRAWSAPVAYDSADNVMADRSAYFLSRYKDLTSRVAAFQIVPRLNPSGLWPKALGLAIGDRITVNRTPLGDGAEISLEQIIEGVTHTFSPMNWTTTYRCSPAETRVFFILDDDDYGELDDDALAY